MQQGITLAVNQSATQNVVFAVGQVSESVLVSANVELVTTGTATVSQVVDERRVVDLPLNGRRVQTLLYLAAGTVDEDQIRSLGYGGVYPGEQLANINGTGLGQVNYQLDGAGHNDTYLNLNLPFPNPDALQEFSLQSDNLSAQFGNAAGGVVNIVTKSGTNQIHGTLFEFLRNGTLNARNFFAPVHDSLKRNQFGGVVGGPIKKDKLFYFGTYQGTRIRTAPEGQIAFVPTQAQRDGDFSSLCDTTGRSAERTAVPGKPDPDSPAEPGRARTCSAAFRFPTVRTRTELHRPQRRIEREPVHDQGGLQPGQAAAQRPVLLHRLRRPGLVLDGESAGRQQQHQRRAGAERCGQLIPTRRVPT